MPTICLLVHTLPAACGSKLLLFALPAPPTLPHRFVPEDMDLSQRQVRDTASEVPPGYAPPDLFTGALQHTDPKLSWDEGDKRRKKVRALLLGKAACSLSTAAGMVQPLQQHPVGWRRAWQRWTSMAAAASMHAVVLRQLLAVLVARP